MKTSLVAGGCGFIGSHLVDLLVEQGQKVIVVDNLVTGRKENLSAHSSDAVQLIEADICTLPEITTPLDRIYNLACPASPADFERLNIEIQQACSTGHENLLKLAQRQKARLLFASSSEVYGNPLEHPQPESYFGNVDPIGFRSCYNEGKRFAETITENYRRRFTMNTRVARIFNTYGPRMRENDGRMIPNFLRQAREGQPLTIFGDGQQTRSFTYVSDLVKGLFLLMESDCELPVNLGSRDEKTVTEAAEVINRLSNNNAGIVYGNEATDDPRIRQPDTTRAMEVLGWSPSISFEQGISLCLEQLRKDH